jgi:hypothetical protein
MKKLLLSLAFIAVALINAMASKVDVATARSVAANFVAGIPGFSSFTNLQLIRTKYASDQQEAFYVFAPAENEGFIIIAAEDALTPVLGYSAKGTFPKELTNLNFDSFIQHFAGQALFVREHNIVAEPDVTSAWQNYLRPAAGQRQPVTTVEPLLINMWNQDYPYNAYCPINSAGPGGHVYAGCVATAMSMIMNYYRFPVHGTGSHSYYLPGYGSISANFGSTYYNWDAMLNELGSNSGMAINAVAELQFHCGVAVNMGYAPDGSGAQSTAAAAAVKNYFGYSSAAQYIEKSSYSATSWENMIIADLNVKKPFYYSGFDSDNAGHAFVLDGYQQPGTGNFFHFNFGWSGSGNGFFTLADVGGFHYSQGMITNFYPVVNYPPNCGSHTITASIGTFEDGSGPLENYIDGASCSWLIAPSDSVDHINLSFNLFDTENNSDIVTVYDGPTITSPVLGVFSGNTLPGLLISSTSRMLVTFTTNGTTNSSGWQAEYFATFPTYCSGTTTFTDPSGSFGDGSGSNNCNNNINCKWKILPPNANNLILTFTSFNLEEGKDQLVIYATGSNQLLASYSGSSIPAPVTSTTGGMLLMLKTNEYNPSAGFDASYTLDNVNIKENSVFREMALFPIPSSGIVNLHLSMVQNQQATFYVNTIDGKTVFSDNLGIIDGSLDKLIDLSALPKGIYIVKVSTPLGSAFDKLIIE